MGELEAKRGRPPGTTESIESLARKDAQQSLKLAERIRKVVEVQLGRVEARLQALDPTNPASMKEIVELTQFLMDGHESVMKTVASTARIASQDPAKAGEGEDGAAAKEFIAQIRGDGV